MKVFALSSHRGPLASLLFGVPALLLLLAGCPNDPPPTLCNQDTDCPSGQICKQSRCEAANKTCNTDRDCATGQQCIQAECKDGPPPCQSNDDCTGGNICQAGRCGPQICSENRNCPSGQQCIGGNCQTPGETPDETTPEEAPAPEGDGGPNEMTPEPTSEDPPQEGQPEKPGVCVPNRNGIIERNELSFRVGAAIVYTAVGSENNPVDVDLKGTKDANGETVWDFSKKLPEDTREIDELLPYKGQWFEGDILDPIPEYASILTRNFPQVGIVLGVYRPTNDALQLLGWYSQEEDVAKVKYNQPVEVLQFPLKLNDTWLNKPVANGSFPKNFTFYRASEDYEFTVDAKGKVKTPAGTYDVLRLRMDFSQLQTLPVVFSVKRISYLFIAECFGVVARVDSTTGETDANFTKAGRLRRISD